MNPFVRLNQGSEDEIRRTKITKYEAARVRFVLKKCGLAPWEKRLSNTHRERFGIPGLTFSLFNETFPTFPIVLGADQLGGIKLHSDPRAFLPAWFQKFSGVPFCPPYEALYDAAKPMAAGRSIGLVFPRNGFAQGMIIHDEGLDSYWTHGCCFVFRGGDKKKSLDLFVRPFSALIDEIYNRGRGWRPDVAE